MKVPLSKPLRYKDTDFDVLDLDLNSLTGRDLIDVEEGLKQRGISVNAWEYSRTYLISVASLALHIPVEVLKSLNAGDFTKIINEVLSFLANPGSSDSMPEALGE